VVASQSVVKKRQPQKLRNVTCHPGKEGGVEERPTLKQKANYCSSTGSGENAGPVGISERRRGPDGEANIEQRKKRRESLRQGFESENARGNMAGKMASGENDNQRPLGGSRRKGGLGL